MILREILTKFGVKADTAPLEKYNGMIKNTISTMIGMKLAQVDVIGGVKELITNMASLSKEIVYGAQRMGVSQENYQRLKEAAEESGAEIGDLQFGMRKLSMLMAGAADGEDKAAEKLEKFGFSAKDATGKLKSSEAVLYEIADKFKTMPNGIEKTNLAMSIFGKGGMALLPMLNKGSEGIKAIGDEFAELGLVLDDESIKSGRKYGRALKDLRDITDSFRLVISKALMPIVSDLVKRMNEWMIANKKTFDKQIQEGVKGFLNAIISVGSFLKSVISFVGGLVEKMGGLEKVLRVVTVLFELWLGFKTAQLLGGLLGNVTSLSNVFTTLKTTLQATVTSTTLMGGALVLIGLLIEDIYTTMNGGEGIFSDWARGAVKYVDWVVAKFKAFLNFITSTGKWVVAKFKAFLNGAVKYVDWVVAKFDWVVAKFKAFQDFIMGTQKVEKWEVVKAQTPKGFENMPVGMMTMGVGQKAYTKEEIDRVNKQFTFVGDSIQENQKAETNVNVGNVVVNVQGSTNMNSNELKKAVDAGVKDSLNNISLDFMKNTNTTKFTPVEGLDY